MPETIITERRIAALSSIPLGDPAAAVTALHKERAKPQEFGPTFARLATNDAGAAAAQARAGSGGRGGREGAGALGVGPVVLLSSREDYVRDRAAELEEELSEGSVLFRALPSGRVGRREVLPALASGPGLVIYTGQGNALGWAGYGGLQAWELNGPGARPIGALVSLSCAGAARIGSTHGLCEEAVRRGAAASALGAVTTVRRDHDRALGLALVARLLAGATCLADALDPGWAELADFRICGDPLAPFVGARGSRATLRRVEAPAAGEALAPVDWSAVAPS